MIILESKPGIITQINPEYIKFQDTIKLDNGNYRIMIIFNEEKEVLNLEMDEKTYQSFVSQSLERLATKPQLAIAELINKARQ